MKSPAFGLVGLSILVVATVALACGDSLSPYDQGYKEGFDGYVAVLCRAAQVDSEDEQKKILSEFSFFPESDSKSYRDGFGDGVNDATRALLLADALERDVVDVCS